MPLNAREALTVREALNAYTIDGARFLGRAREFGSLEVGKSADFVILDRDILALGDSGKADDIAGTPCARDLVPRRARLPRGREEIIVRRAAAGSVRALSMALALLLCCGLAAAAGVEVARLPRADAIVRDEMRSQQIPGLAIAVIDHGKVILAQGYGYANLEHQVPVITDTVFQSGSVGKQFTSTAVMLFVQDGKLALEDPITRYLPEAPPEWAAIRIRHLLTHTSGIRDYGYEASYDTRRAVTEADLVRMACAQPLEFQPGERYSYSNTGYLLLGAILDRIGGRHYSEVLRDRVFKPLGMDSARLIDEAAIVPHRAAGYHLVQGRITNQEWVAPEQNTTADFAVPVAQGHDRLGPRSTRWSDPERRVVAQGVYAGHAQQRPHLSVRLCRGRIYKCRTGSARAQRWRTGLRHLHCALPGR